MRSELTQQEREAFRQWIHSWDWILINSSAGKDSQTMLRRVYNLAVEFGVPLDRLVVVHADLGRVEWKGTKALARIQAEHYGLRFEIVKRTKDRDLLEHVENRGKWPGMGPTRYCTSDHKRAPVHTLMTKLVAESVAHGHQILRALRHPKTKAETYIGRKVRILNCMGMRAQESPGREKMPVLKMNGERKPNKNTGKLQWTGASNGKREVWNWLPIHKWTLEEVWADIHASGVPHHFAYDLGMPRLSCCFCIYATPTALKLAGKHNPELLAEYVRVEQKINHSFKPDVRLEDIQRAVLAEEEIGAVADWEM